VTASGAARSAIGHAGTTHTEFFNPSECASDYEFRYLTTGDLPSQGTACPQSVQPF